MKKDNALKYYMQKHFAFRELKKIGVFPKDMKSNDYEGQAKRICEIFELESIYDYSKHEISCHLSYAWERPATVDKVGKLKVEPFVTTIFHNQLHI